MKANEFVPFNEHTVVHREDLPTMFKDFLPLVMKELRLSDLPKIKLELKLDDEEQPSFGRFVNNEHTIHLAIQNRHPIDICRTLAHELVHYKQDTEHKLDALSGQTGSPVENEANTLAGIIMRKFDKQFPKYFHMEPITIKESKDDYEIRNYDKLDSILADLCSLIIDGQQSTKDYGMVAAAVLDPDNTIVSRLNYPGKDGRRIHAERAAIEAYKNKYGDIPEGSIILTTLSPCNEHMDERDGTSCTDIVNHSGVKKVYCGYIDPTQKDDHRHFNLMETGNEKLRTICKQFADTFLK
jgi:pyrimidine deaminase RibD-like protein